MTDSTVEALKAGKVGIVPTDTIYGLTASALNSEAVEKIYTIKHRDPKKPCIILISDLGDLHAFGISLETELEKQLDKVWPGPVSVLLACPNEKFFHLHRGTNELAFRLPDKSNLRDLIKETGPLCSTSANPEGELPAQTIEQAKNYFGDKVSFYEDAGKLDGQPSTLVRFGEEGMQTIRP